MEVVAAKDRMRLRTTATVRNSLDRMSELPPPGLLYWFMHGLGRWLWPAFGGFDLSGTENIPESGPFLLISNHQSALDPFFIQTWFRRPVHPMAKSTQFASPIFAAVMKRCYSFPVRRFQVDPQAVRTALRRLRAGHPVHIYIEGERTWDGSLRPPRPGTVRLALKAGVPILPCALDGAYDAMPRWDSRPRRSRVKVAFGEPFMLPQIDDRASREAALPEASARIIGAISDLLGVAPPGVDDDGT
ncbi:MAG TPA: lysophospholipid acyltransferase family protein [Longimicrobiales bacterium]|nr:lysophospholipid acyltransferase family protein [Longimicrobiales bacterium]